ncbi:MAG: hypothetical protein ABI673_07685 [Novosphingobium sp.]
MLRLILSNRWLAAIWATMTLISIASFVREDSPSMKALDGAASRLHAQRQQEAEAQRLASQVEAENDGGDSQAAAVSEPAFGEGSDPTPRD